MKLVGSFLAIISLVVSGVSQVNDPNLNTCTRVASDSGDFSVCLPAKDFVIVNENRFQKIYYAGGGVYLTVMMDRGDDAKDRFRQALPFTAPSKEQTFVSGDFLISQRSLDSKKFVERELKFASSKGLYSARVVVRTSAVSYLDRFLVAIRLEGKPIFTAKVSPFDEIGVIRSSQLQTSSKVAEALKSSDSTQKKLVVAEKSDSTDDDESGLSGRVIILSNPRATYTDSARSAKAVGTVKLKVTFLANGTIGPIRIVDRVHPDLDRNSFESAKKIKFLPAEVAGKPVDFSRIMEYSFSIY
ncbi:MAG: TonB family protein [Acidobacteriota bacterium]